MFLISRGDSFLTVNVPSTSLQASEGADIFDSADKADTLDVEILQTP
jgi:hypothetical protein